METKSYGRICGDFRKYVHKWITPDTNPNVKKSKISKSRLLLGNTEIKIVSKTLIRSLVCTKEYI